MFTLQPRLLRADRRAVLRPPEPPFGSRLPGPPSRAGSESAQGSDARSAAAVRSARRSPWPRSRFDSTVTVQSPHTAPGRRCGGRCAEQAVWGAVWGPAR